ncbi:hypothetical protein HDU88_001323 [Geranomyces variabilis]|nr:hypothetical protein HDU88_001323 [Geranomyces variabilis]
MAIPSSSSSSPSSSSPPPAYAGSSNNNRRSVSRENLVNAAASSTAGSFSSSSVRAVPSLASLNNTNAAAAARNTTTFSMAEQASGIASAGPGRRPTRPTRSQSHMHLKHLNNESNYSHTFQMLFRFTGSVIPHVLLPAIVLTLWATLWTAFYQKFPDTWLTGFIPNSNILVTIISVVMGLLLVFRNNTAYDRYWEGRRLLATLECQVRNMSRFIWIGVAAKSPHGALEKRGAMNLLVAFMHATKHYLRNELGVHYDDVYPYISHLPDYAPDNIVHATDDNSGKNLPLEISFHLAGFVMKARQTDEIDVSQQGCMNNALNSMIDCLTGFERIRGTPLPHAYGIHLKQTLFVYLLSLPFQLLRTGGWSTIVMCCLASFTLLGLEAIGGEIENPFGFDANDLPIDDICDMIQHEILSIMNRPEKLSVDNWAAPWEDLTSTHADLNQEAMLLARKSADAAKRASAASNNNDKDK